VKKTTHANGVRILTDRACRNKIRHATRESAEEHLARLANSRNMFAYKCLVCGAWHVGHDRVGQRAEAPKRDPWAEATKGVKAYRT
jgi:hypothetical protein